MTGTSAASCEAQPNNSRSSSSPQAALDTWPFWAPSDAAAVEVALDLAGVGAGTRLTDLGCGDGQVLIAAARRGAVVSGVEADEVLVEEARAHLADAGVDGEVRVGDLFDPATRLDADVYFSYLAPATLQRLLPTVRHERGTKLVTVDFDVPGLVPTRRSGSARLYVLPGRQRPVTGTVGWDTAGTLVAASPDCQSLSCLSLIHPGGDATVDVTKNLGPVVSAVGGADELDGPGHLAIDLRWEPMDEGTIRHGALRVAAVDDHALVVIATEDDDGMWELSAKAVAALRRALRRRTRPTSLQGLLDETRV